MSIPLILNLTPAKFISFQFGPQFGILLDKHKNLFENGKDAFSGGDFSLLGGVQLNLGAFKVSGRYVVGLTNINDAGNSDKWKSRDFSSAQVSGLYKSWLVYLRPFCYAKGFLFEIVVPGFLPSVMLFIYCWRKHFMLMRSIHSYRHQNNYHAPYFL